MNASDWTEALVDELVARIAATIVGQVEAADIAEARRKQPENMTTYDYLLRGLEYHRLGGVTSENSREAVKWFERAIESDPNYGLPYAWWTCAASRLPEFDTDKGLKYVNKAIELDENNAEAHRIMGSYQMWLGEFEAAEHHHRRAMALNPSSAYIRGRSAAFYTFNRQPERALELLAEADTLDPFLPVWCLEERVSPFLISANITKLARRSTAWPSKLSLAQLCRSLCFSPRGSATSAKRSCRSY
jgi:adenylate cyclase